MSEAAKKSAKPSRLGKGLTALIGDYGGANDDGEAPVVAKDQDIEIALISPNPKQPRRTFSEPELEELASSIRAKGVLQPILVRPDPKDGTRFQIIAGERRWRAAQKAGLKAIPAVVRAFDELEVLEIGIIENVQRQDLNPIEEAEAYRALMDRFGRTQEALSEVVGKSRVHIANTLRLLKLPEACRSLVTDGHVTAGHARAALTSDDPLAILEQASDKGLSVRETEKLARQAATGSVDGPIETKSAGRDPKDIDTQALEADLSRTLGLDVDIRHKKKGGELRISYRHLEQLDDICRRLSKGH